MDLQDKLRQLRLQYPWPPNKPPLPPNEHGWLDDSNRELLGKFMGPQVQVIVELGTWLGQSARWMLDQSPNAHCLCVDWWQGDQYINRSHRFLPWIPTLYDTFLSTNWTYRHRLIPIREISLVGLMRIHDVDIVPDVVFVDANHAYEAVKEDIRLLRDFWPNVPMVGDDYTGVDFPGVKRAVHEAVQKYDYDLLTKGKTWQLTSRR